MCVRREGEVCPTPDGHRSIASQYHAIITGCIKVAEARGLRVPTLVIEAARRRIIVAGGRFHHDEPCAPLLQLLLDFGHERRTGAAALGARVHGDSIEIERALCGWRSAKAGVADQAVRVEGADEFIVACGV